MWWVANELVQSPISTGLAKMFACVLKNPNELFGQSNTNSGHVSLASLFSLQKKWQLSATFCYLSDNTRDSYWDPAETQLCSPTNIK